MLERLQRYGPVTKRNSDETQPLPAANLHVRTQMVSEN